MNLCSRHFAKARAFSIQRAWKRETREFHPGWEDLRRDTDRESASNIGERLSNFTGKPRSKGVDTDFERIVPAIDD